MDDSANRKGKDPLALVLLAVAGLLGALSLYRLSALAVAVKAPQIEVAKKVPQGEVQARVAAEKSAAGSLKKKNLFIPPETPRNPVTEVAGILGNEALINGRWYKAGAKVGEGPNSAVIVAVEPTKIRVRWSGKETEFLPMNASGSGSSSPTARGPDSGPSPPGEGRRGGRSSSPPEGVVIRSSGGRQGSLLPEIAAMQERMRNASSPEERRKIIEEMNQQSSGR
jgi:hypothetical protein